MKTEKRLIYADEVIEEIDEIIGNINFSSPYQNDIHLIVDGLERARDCLLDAPSVDAVEVKHGQWEQKIVDNYHQTRCTACDVVAIKANIDTFGSFPIVKWEYCPNCGAKMEAIK